MALAACSTHTSPAALPRPTVDQRWAALGLTYHADAGWINRVNQESQYQPLLTAQLQDEWLAGHPIVFPGALLDVIKLPSGYDLLQVIGADSVLPNGWDQELALELFCPDAAVRALLASGRHVVGIGTVDPTVIVIADVSRITSSKTLADTEERGMPEPDDDYGATDQTQLYDWKIGYGRCVHLEPAATQPAPRT